MIARINIHPWKRQSSCRFHTRSNGNHKVSANGCREGGREAGARRGRGRAWDGVRNRVVVLLPFPCTASSLALFPSLAVPLLNSFRYSRSPSYHLCTVSAFFCFPTCTATRQPHRSKKSASCFLSRCRGGNCIVDDEHSRQVSKFLCRALIDSNDKCLGSSCSLPAPHRHRSRRI